MLARISRLLFPPETPELTLSAALLQKEVRHTEECKYDFTKATLLRPNKMRKALPRNKPLKNEDSHQTSSNNLYSRRIIAYSDDAQPQSGGMQYLGDINSMVRLWVHNYMLKCFLVHATAWYAVMI